VTDMSSVRVVAGAKDEKGDSKDGPDAVKDEEVDLRRAGGGKRISVKADCSIELVCDCCVLERGCN